MENDTTKKQRGFIKIIIVLVILIAILSFFGFNIKEFMGRDIVRENFGYVWEWIATGWNRYLAGPANYLWNDIFVKLIWYPFVDALKSIKGGALPIPGKV